MGPVALRPDWRASRATGSPERPLPSHTAKHRMPLIAARFCIPLDASRSSMCSKARLNLLPGQGRTAGCSVAESGSVPCWVCS